MKNITKFFGIVLVFSTLIANAAQINWGSKGLIYDGDTVANSTAGYTVTAYLFYLGDITTTPTPTTPTWSSSIGDLDHLNLTVGGNIYGERNAAAAGNLNPAGDPHTVTAATTSGKSVFGILYVLTNTNWDEGEYKWYASNTFVYDESIGSTENSNGDKWTGASNTFTHSTLDTAANKALWVTVPEPATGAMALAGLALLFRRKRK